MINDLISQEIADVFLTKRIKLSHFISVSILNDHCTIGMTNPGGSRFNFSKKAIVKNLIEIEHLINRNLTAILEHEEGYIRFYPKNDIVKITVFVKFFGLKIPMCLQKAKKNELLNRIEEIINS